MALSPITSATVTISGSVPVGASFIGPWSALDTITQTTEVVEPQAPSMSAEFTSLDGLALPTTQPAKVTLTRRLSAASTCQVTVDANTEGAASIEVGAVRLRIWRNNVLRFAGPFVRTQDDADAGGASTVTADAEDAAGPMADAAILTRRSFTQVDQADIAQALWDQWEVGHVRTIWPAYSPTGVLRDRTYEVGKPILEAVTELGQVDDGFWWFIDPDDTRDTSCGRFVVRYPDPGPFVPSARLEYGIGTRANVQSYQVETLPPVNVAIAFGSATGEGDSRLVSVITDQASVDAYGAWVKQDSYDTVTTQATLDQHAQGMIRPAPRRTYSLTMSPEGPRLWDDFDIGSRLPLYIRGPRLEVLTTVVVTEAQVVWEGDTPVERVASMVVQETSSPQALLSMMMA